MTLGDRAYLAEIDRKWDRESWYRRPDGRWDWLALEGYVLIGMMLVAFVVMLAQAAMG